jgi:hypothetical protein
METGTVGAKIQSIFELQIFFLKFISQTVLTACLKAGFFATFFSA